MKKIYTIRKGKLVRLSEDEFGKKDTDKKVKERFKLQVLTDIGMITMLPLLGGSILGSILDNRFSTKPILTLLFLSFGTVIGFYNIFRLLKDTN